MQYVQLNTHRNIGHKTNHLVAIVLYKYIVITIELFFHIDT